MKYTNEQIKKALECCKVCSLMEDCNECPYVECSTKTGCVNEMIADTLDLISRQEAEKKAMLAEIRQYKHENKKLMAECDNQKAEIERLRHETAEFPNRVLWSRGLILTKSLAEYDELINDIASEAIKEFAERLKEKAWIYQHGKGDSIIRLITTDDIDNIFSQIEMTFAVTAKGRTQTMNKTCNTCACNKVCDHNKWGWENCGNHVQAMFFPKWTCNDDSSATEPTEEENK